VQTSTVRVDGTIPDYPFGWFDWFCLWYPPAWLILFNRHWQHYKPDPEGWNGLEYALFLIPGGFYLALLLRWLRLRIRRLCSQSPIVFPEPGPDPAYQHAFRQEIITPIVHRYFRGELHQLEALPPTGPVILAMNHAGMCFPWDFVSLGLLLGEQRNWFIQPLAHPLFFDHPWLQWWLPKGWAQVLGGVRAERESFETAIHESASANHSGQDFALLYAPEGWRGLAKGWQQRYELARFDSSFIQLSVRHQVPIVPVVCVGSEGLHPYTSNANWLARRFKMPMFPLSPLIPVFVLFPSMGVWASRTRLRYYLQPYWHPWEGLSSEPNQVRQTVLHRLGRELRSRMQATLNGLVGRRKPEGKGKG
jgi:1-acyl-sn-glycerol-3-phosphate acyltransferase